MNTLINFHAPQIKLKKRVSLKKNHGSQDVFKIRFKRSIDSLKSTLNVITKIIKRLYMMNIKYRETKVSFSSIQKTLVTVLIVFYPAALNIQCNIKQKLKIFVII